ncbi:hypothetical protein EN930_01125, partial [Mesorhizobium sp. M7A.F.Ca.CA.004.11.2.1]|uniref:hypothetical protein n=1 Tax=Mesorhizobium sp. M7A.F.Ca.CA.004.11.2.1 TaxID=2496699 RepID=UPI000FD5BE41
LNAILAAAGYNFSLLLRWLKGFLWLLIAALQSQPKSSKPDPSHCSRPTGQPNLKREHFRGAHRVQVIEAHH